VSIDHVNPSHSTQTIAPDRPTNPNLPPATPPQTIAEQWHSLLTEKTALLGHKIDPPPDRTHPHIPSTAPSNPPRDPLKHYQGLLTEKTALLGHNINPPPDRPPSATRSPHTSPTPANPSATPPPIANPAGQNDRNPVPCDRHSSALEPTEARRERENASEYNRPTLAKASAIRSPLPPPKTTSRPSRIPRHCDRSSRRRAGVGFRVAA
jgi:hypothetical protein